MKVSIIIPTFKRANILPRAIDSVLNQTYKNIEIIVVSDGIDNPTNIVMKKYTSNSKVNYFFYKNNMGGNYARNFGIQNATGEYIAFLDDDDFWDETKLEKQMKHFYDEKIGLVYCGKEHQYLDENISYISSALKRGNLSEEIFEKNYIGSTSCVVIRKNIIDKVGYFDENLLSLQDYDLWIRICQETLVGAVNEPLLLYRNKSANNQISVNINKRIKSFAILMEKYENYFKYNNNIKKKFVKNNIESILRMAQRNYDKDILFKYSKIYMKNYKSIKSLFFLFTTLLPYSFAMKLRRMLS